MLQNYKPAVRLFTLLAATVLTPCSNAPGQAVTPYKRDDLLAQSKVMLEKARASQDGLASTILERYPTSYTMLVVRVKTGLVEQHEKWADVMIPLEGEAAVVTGGEIEGGKSTTPGEVRGVSILGGQRSHIAQGEMLRVPAGVPHQVMVEKGGAISYFVVKILEEPKPAK